MTRSGGSIPLVAFGAALAAAVATGLAWGAIARATGYEIGVAALGIGLAVGYATHFASGRRTGMLLQVMASFVALFGFLAGKFLLVHLMVTNITPTLVPEEQGGDSFLTTMAILKIFLTEPELWFGLYDTLWIGFAVLGAWSVLRERKPAKA